MAAGGFDSVASLLSCALQERKRDKRKSPCKTFFCYGISGEYVSIHLRRYLSVPERCVCIMSEPAGADAHFSPILGQSDH